MLKKLVIALMLLIIMLTSSCRYITGESLEMTQTTIPESSTGMEPETSQLPESELPFKIEISTAPAHLQGERILFGIGIANLSSGTITIDPFPPAIRIKSIGQDKAVFSSPAGMRTYDINADQPFVPTKDTWDQRDNSGEQVSPGWYEIGYEYVIIEQSTSKKYTTNPTVRFQIVSPDSAMNKDIDVNRSVTAEGITITLERIELNAVKATVYTFTTPPDYNLPEGSLPEQAESLMINSSVEYSIDSGITKQPIDIKGQFNRSGARLIWELEPIPVNARELIFTITQIGDWKGRWEFKVPLVE